MHLTHKVGNPNAQWHLVIENTGGRALRIKAISLSFTRTGAQPFVLPAQNYLRTPDAKENVMLTPFRMAPGAEWAHVLNFFNMFSREDEKEYRRIESAIRSDILGQKAEPENEDRLCEADPENVAPALAFFARHFRWEPGEYELELVITTDAPTADVRRKYLFSLFESESSELRNYREGYKYGAGVYWVSQAQPGLVVPVREQ